MLELREWIAAARFEPKPWMLLGKGPSFSRRHEFPLSDYNLMSLNHVVRELKVNVAHIIDADVAETCADHLLDHCDWLVMPRRPHVDFKPGDMLLEDCVERIPVLRTLDEQGRLVWYNAATADPVGDSPVIGVHFFSSEAALNILGHMGVRTVRSLGVDGGRRYSAAFSELESSTRLANSQPSFDVQFAEIEEIVQRWEMDYAPMVEPLKIFVALDESQLVAARVLEFTIQEHASQPVRLVPMLDMPTPTPKDERNRPRTGFSFYRFLIPSLAGYRGRALYLDADMQVFGDVSEIWNVPMDGKAILCTSQTEVPDEWKDTSWFKPGRQLSVMLLDCSRLRWDVDEIVAGLDRGDYTYEQLMFDLCIVDPDEIADTLPPEWNHLEHFEAGETKLLHYTVVPTQPWKNDRNPLAELWTTSYRDAVRAGAVPREEVERLVRKRHVKWSLLEAFPEGARRSLADVVLTQTSVVVQAIENRVPILRRPAVQGVKRRIRRLVAGAASRNP